MNAEIAAATAALVGPLLPYLLEVGQGVGKGIGKGASEAIGKAGGEAAWAAAVRVWERIRGRAEDRDGVRAAAQSLCLEPAESDTQELFARALKRLFDREPELAEAVRTDLGGTDRIQMMLAEDGGKLERVAQELSGPGNQSMTARNSGSINGAVQIQTGGKE